MFGKRCIVTALNIVGGAMNVIHRAKLKHVEFTLATGDNF
jgi:hypothetical protein